MFFVMHLGGFEPLSSQFWLAVSHFLLNWQCAFLKAQESSCPLYIEKAKCFGKLGCSALLHEHQWDDLCKMGKLRN